VSSLRTRIRPLERELGIGVCPRCGLGPGILYEIAWDWEDEPPRKSSPPCGYCGRSRLVVIDGSLDQPPRGEV
jgi:hypothetical protein